MWPAEHLKVVNNDSLEILQDYVVDCEYVDFYSSSDDKLLLYGYRGSSLRIIPTENPDETQIISLEEKIDSCTSFTSHGICTILGSNKIAFFNKNQEWKCTSLHSFNLDAGKIIACFPVTTSIVIFIQDSYSLLIGISVNPPEWKQIAELDCLTIAKSVYVTDVQSQNGPVLLIGTEDGHVYQLVINTKHCSLLCDIQQPVAKIISYKNDVTILGRFGKIVFVSLNNLTKVASSSFAPTPIFDGFQLRNRIYLNGSEKLYSLELKQSSSERTVGDPVYAKIEFVEVCKLIGESIFVLTKNGSIYQSDLAFESQRNFACQRSGNEIKPMLLEIQRSTDQLKALNKVNEQMLINVSQISIALNMLNQSVAELFPIVVRSLSDPISAECQHLVLNITNKSAWNLSSSHWAFQIATRHAAQRSVPLRQELKTEETLQLECPSLPLDDSFSMEVKISFVFHVIDPRKKSEQQIFSVFPLSTVKLTVMDFLEPATPADISGGVETHMEILGFRRKKPSESPWPILLQRSWHRGFSQRLTDPFPLQLVGRCGLHLFKLTLKEDENQTDSIWILRIESPNVTLLNLLRTELFRQIEVHFRLSTSEVVNIPIRVLDDIQNLRGRLNYIHSLSQWDASDTDPIIEEFRLLMAKQFSVR